MTRYIDADSAIDEIKLLQSSIGGINQITPEGKKSVIKIIDAKPADFIPKYLRTAKWKVYGDEYCPQCTQCGAWMPFARYHRCTGTNAREMTRFCPGCGSKMIAIDQCSDCPHAENGCSREDGVCYACREDAWVYGRPIRVYEEQKANKNK